MENVKQQIEELQARMIQTCGHTRRARIAARIAALEKDLFEPVENCHVLTIETTGGEKLRANIRARSADGANNKAGKIAAILARQLARVNRGDIARYTVAHSMVAPRFEILVLKRNGAEFRGVFKSL